MTFDEYLKIDATNWSLLKEARRSPLHYLHRLKEPKEDTTRLAIGRATHTAVFEPDRFLLDYALFAGNRRAGKEWNECCKANRGKTILKAEEYATCLAMRDAVRSHPVAGPALAPPGEAEKVITWTDEETGIACKGRLDWWRVGLLSDLKTTVDVSPRRFGTIAERMAYHGQMAFYRAGLIANGLDAPPPRIIAVEAAPPYDVAVFRVDDDALYAGELLVRDLLQLVARCKFQNTWPGQVPEESSLLLPAWAFEEEEALNGLDLKVTATEAT